MPYWNKTALDGEQLDERLQIDLRCENCADDADDDYKIDITSTKRISIAYRNNLIGNSLSVADYLGKSFSYPPSGSELSSLNIIENSISTKDWKFDAKQFIEDEKRQYVSYNDMGFVPVYNRNTNGSGSTYINKIYNEIAARNKWYTDCLSGKG